MPGLRHADLLVLDGAHLALGTDPCGAPAPGNYTACGAQARGPDDAVRAGDRITLPAARGTLQVVDAAAGVLIMTVEA